MHRLPCLSTFNRLTVDTCNPWYTARSTSCHTPWSYSNILIMTSKPENMFTRPVHCCLLPSIPSAPSETLYIGYWGCVSSEQTYLSSSLVRSHLIFSWTRSRSLRWYWLWTWNCDQSYCARIQASDWCRSFREYAGNCSVHLFFHVTLLMLTEGWWRNTLDKDNITYRVGSAEDLPFVKDNTVDLFVLLPSFAFFINPSLYHRVIGGTMAHWLDPEPWYTEMSRVSPCF